MFRNIFKTAAIIATVIVSGSLGACTQYNGPKTVSGIIAKDAAANPASYKGMKVEVIDPTAAAREEALRREGKSQAPVVAAASGLTLEDVGLYLHEMKGGTAEAYWPGTRKGCMTLKSRGDDLGILPWADRRLVQMNMGGCPSSKHSTDGWVSYRFVAYRVVDFDHVELKMEQGGIVILVRDPSRKKEGGWRAL